MHTNDLVFHRVPELNVVVLDEVDLEFELERHELARLLDRAMSLLPPETRMLLVERYINELPRQKWQVVLA